MIDLARRLRVSRDVTQPDRAMPSLSRRLIVSLAALAGASIAATRPAVAAPPRHATTATTRQPYGAGGDPSFAIDTDRDQTAALQAAIDRLSPTGGRLLLPPGRIVTSGLVLRPGTHILGVPGRTRLELAAGGPLLTGRGCEGVHLEGFGIDGRLAALPGPGRGGLVDIADAMGVTLRALTVSRSRHSGITLARVGGRVSDCTLSDLGGTALHSDDAAGLAITGNTVTRIGNNGILVWRQSAGEDGTLVTGNRISHIAARFGGTGQNGNGINVFRAGGVHVAGNHISDCAYSAVRANSASNVQILSNTCTRLGEVAVYAEFAFTGALIASNLIDGAATGISVTNFDAGGRLAVVQGNLVRNIVRREHEPVDTRGEAIAVEADASITGNVVEEAATCGLMLGFDRYMRDIVASSNLIRRARIGIAVTGDPAAGRALLSANMISGASAGAIRRMRDRMPYGEDLATYPVAGSSVTLAGNVVV